MNTSPPWTSLRGVQGTPQRVIQLIDERVYRPALATERQHAALKLKLAGEDLEGNTPWVVVVEALKFLLPDPAAWRALERLVAGEEALAILSDVLGGVARERAADAVNNFFMSTKSAQAFSLLKEPLSADDLAIVRAWIEQ